MQSYIPTFDSVATRLAALGYSQTDAANLDTLATAHPQLVLMLNADPHQHPEVADNAIIVPEVLKSLPGATPHVCWADPAASRTLASRFGVLKYPALVFLRGGQYTGVIVGLMDWPDVVHRFAELLAAPARRPPSVGIPVTSPTSGACQ
ncbi:MAG: hypothetical protein KA757_02060 [Vogesella sp.]|nr:hypothetical protein [Vogesella sp.]